MSEPTLLDLFNRYDEVVGFIVVVVGGIWTLERWTSEQKWRRLQAIFARIASFDETPGTRNAMMILKTPEVTIPLWDPSEPPDRRYASVSWAEAAAALRLEGYRSTDVSNKAGAIRNCFEDFLNRMTQIEIYLEGGLLTPKEVRHLVMPWVARVNSGIDDDGLSQALLHYMSAHHKFAALSLFNRPEFRLRSSDGAGSSVTA